jgi:UDP-N-acetylmuramoyl-tripeptide--D-alanyl-D-alanine ligase
MSSVSYREFLLESQGSWYNSANNNHNLINLLVPRVSTDTRELQNGQAFLALKGENFDGHDFLQQAIDKGASVLIVNANCQLLDKLNLNSCHVILVNDTLLALGLLAKLHASKFKAKIAAITGSCGKTTVKQMLCSILEQSHKVLSTKGSFNNEIGVPKTLLQLDDSYDYVVLEMGARNLHDIEYLCDIAQPDVSIVNNVAPVHLETFGSTDQIALAKGKIYTNLKELGTAVINVDDNYAPFWMSTLDYQNIVTFGAERSADVTCAYIIYNKQSTVVEIVTDIGSVSVSIPIPGNHNISNALAASALARAFEISLHDIKHGLENFKPALRRLQYFKGLNDSTIIDDSYNANPVASMAAIDLLALHNGKKIMVFADMLELGTDSQHFHTLIGEYAKKNHIDYLFTYGKQSLATQQAFSGKGEHFANKQELATTLAQQLDAQTLVLIKGSNGMHLEDVTKLVVLVD